MSKPQARIGDMSMCNLHPPPPPAGPVVAPTAIAFVGAPTVLVGGQPAARVGDSHVGLGPHPIALGSMTVLIHHHIFFLCSFRAAMLLLNFSSKIA